MGTKSGKSRITISVINEMNPGQVVWDSELSGFGVRKQSRAVSYILKTRINGRQKWVTIGKHGSPWTPGTARKEAVILMREASVGHDVTAIRKAKQEKINLEQLAAEFEEDHIEKLKPKSRHEYKRIIKQYIVPTLGNRQVEVITKGDVSKLHRKRAHTPRMANLIISILSKMMSWAEEYGYRQEGTNPCKGIKKYRETKRQRYLSIQELSRLGSAIREAEEENLIGTFAATAIRLLIFTGARQGEILNLKWEYVDMPRKRLWLPDSKTGQKAISLNEQAIEELKSLPRLNNNPHVIVGHRIGRHLVNISKPWIIVRDKAGLKDVRMHDLRHSFASVAVASGASLPMIGKLLGHTQTQTTARYAHLADEPIDQLNQEVGDVIGRAMSIKMDSD